MALLRNCSRALTASVLCVLMAEQPLLMAAPAVKQAPAPASGEIQGNDRVLHALNRLTYGPRPGDVEAVKQMGLDKWFEQQLNPESLDNSDLQSRLAQFPAMKMSEKQLMLRFPPNQMIRAYSNGLMPIPTDPIAHAVVTDQIYFYNQYRKQLLSPQVKPADGAASDGMQKQDAAMTGDSMAADASTDPMKSKRRKASKIASQAPDVSAMASGSGDNDMAPAAMSSATPPTKKEGKKTAMKADVAKNSMSDEQVQAVLALPPDERFQKVLSFTPQQLAAFRKAAGQSARFTMARGMTPEQREVLGALSNSRQLITGEIYASNLLRDIYSTHQLQEVMTDFWLNHFNVYIKKNEVTPYQLGSYERDTIAPHALGHFEDLLVATAKSPAMLEYLDNWSSVGPNSPHSTHRSDKTGTIDPNAPRFADNPDAKAQLQQAVQQRAAKGLNENYGRELMELHTLGVTGGYTQKDVTEVSKVFTGWTIDRPFRGGSYYFDNSRHESGPKTVLGQTINEGGEKEGLEVLHMLATSPKTAHFISQEIAIRFVADVPPATLVDRMAATFLATNGDIKEVLRTMYKSPEFWSKDVYRAKVKTPQEYVVSAVRASGVEIRSPQLLELALERLGQPLFGAQPPTGYYWRASDWVSTSALVSRMNFALALSVNALPGITTDWSGMLNEDGVASLKPTAAGVLSAPEKEKQLEGLLMNRPVSEKTRQTVLSEAEKISVDEAASKFPIDPSDLADLTGGDTRGGGKNKGDGALVRELGFTRPNAIPTDRQASVIAGLLIGSPEFQRR